MRLIDADALIQKRNHAKAYAPDMYVIGQGYVMDAPTIDAVPVVRGECKHLGIKDFVYGYCKLNMSGIVKPNDYCSYGEKTEDKQ